MLEKTMKQVLIKKINKWLESVADTDVVDAIKKDLIVTGGCFTSFLQNEVPNDYDCYFRTKESALKVAEYYAGVWNSDHEGQTNRLGKSCNVLVLDCDSPSKEILDYYQVSDPTKSMAVVLSNLIPGRIKMIFPSDGVTGDTKAISADTELGLSPIEIVSELDDKKVNEIIEKEDRQFVPVFISSNAITLRDNIQIIVRFHGEPNVIHDTFDFVHTKAYFDFKSGEIVIPKEVYECIINKTLRYTGSKYPVCSIFRVRKFIERGWTINAGQLLKMCMQISQLDLQDINTLEDQLIGVDSLYFMQLIEQFRIQEKNPDFKLTASYVESIIDKIF